VSSFAYGALARHRERSDVPEHAAVARWIDTVAAVVPAEALAIQVAAVDLATTTTRDINSNVVTTISNPGFLRLTFLVLFILSGILYALAHVLVERGRAWDPLDFARTLLPPFAFVAWTLGMKASVMDAVLPEFSDTSRNTAALVLGVILVVLAYLLSNQRLAK